MHGCSKRDSIQPFETSPGSLECSSRGQHADQGALTASSSTQAASLKSKGSPWPLLTSDSTQGWKHHAQAATLTLFAVSAAAFDSNNSRTTTSWPLLAAALSGVDPSCHEQQTRTMDPSSQHDEIQDLKLAIVHKVQTAASLNTHSHLLCSVDARLRLQQQPHNSIMAAARSSAERRRSVLRKSRQLPSSSTQHLSTHSCQMILQSAS